ncbi:hypothetical protein V8G54_006253 [Vigna mungo]|uniref:Lipid transfer protein n=1 Tax=Vigna mungo TaxID=3915 RepID=A0AAQ3S7U1_VIGMU
MGWSEYVVLLLLSLSLLSVPMVRSETCGNDLFKTCLWSMLIIGLDGQLDPSCCPLLSEFSASEAYSCLGEAFVKSFVPGVIHRLRWTLNINATVSTIVSSCNLPDDDDGA